MNIPNFQEEFNQKLKENISLVRKQINNKDFVLKIGNHAKKFNRTFEQVKQKILEDDMYAEFFAKDPAKQNIYEKLVANYINGLLNVEDFKNLPNSAKLYIVNGKICSKKENDVKSIDFTFKFKNKNFFVSHKYIRDVGGAQDNQYLEIRNFLRNCAKISNGENHFIALCDGEYFKKKLEILKKEFGSTNVHILTTYEIEDFLKNLEN